MRACAFYSHISILTCSDEIESCRYKNISFCSKKRESRGWYFGPLAQVMNDISHVDCLKYICIWNQNFMNNVLCPRVYLMLLLCHYTIWSLTVRRSSNSQFNEQAFIHTRTRSHTCNHMRICSPLTLFILPIQRKTVLSWWYRDVVEFVNESQFQ